MYTNGHKTRRQPPDWTLRVNERFRLEVERALFRIMQEALANIGRHSQAKNVDLCLVYTSDQISFTVRDDGHGFNPRLVQPGLGLYSMRERAQALPQGKLILDSAPGKGTSITVHCQV